jgi:thioredoxin-related protein
MIVANQIFMKTIRIVFVCLVWILSESIYAQKTPTAESVMKNAFEQASKEDKKVLLIFHASWCGWCKKMEKAILDETCKEFFHKNYIITYLTVQEGANNKALENAGGEMVMDNYGGKEQGLPYWAILDKTGKLLEDSKMQGSNIGCPASPEEVEAFIKKLQNTSKPSQKEIEAVRARFLKNK